MLYQRLDVGRAENGVTGACSFGESSIWVMEYVVCLIDGLKTPSVGFVGLVWPALFPHRHILAYNQLSVESKAQDLEIHRPACVNWHSKYLTLIGAGLSM